MVRLSRERETINVSSYLTVDIHSLCSRHVTVIIAISFSQNAIAQTDKLVATAASATTAFAAATASAVDATKRTTRLRNPIFGYICFFYHLM